MRGRATNVLGDDQPRRRNDAIYRDLRHKIVQTKLEPGTRLREQTLASRYGTSRTPIRRVLDRLANDGLVTMRPGAGASVSVVDFQDLAQVWAVRIKVTELMADVIELPGEPDVRGEVVDLLDRVRAVAGGPELVTLFDEYHVVLLAIMKPGPVRRIYDQTYAQTARMFTILLPKLDLEAELEAVAVEVERFAEAFEAGSPTAIAANRLSFLESLLDRINAIPLLKPLDAVANSRP